MSAIFGILGSNEPIDNNVIANAQLLLKHCGDNCLCDSFITTDKCGRHSQNVIFSCHANNENRQQKSNLKQDVFIAFDGEIYNSEEIKKQLKNEDIPFEGTTDTKLLVKLYSVYGLDSMLSLLDGVWGMCLVDKSKDKTYIIRDRMGEKPLYYYSQRQLFMFSSEYKAFYAHPEFKPELNQESVSEYFVFRYPCGDSTFLKDVNLISPGCYLEISGTKVQKHRYWNLPASRQNKLTKEENKNELKRLIEKSVRNRLLNREYIGAQLSGGVDSSYLCATMKKQLGQSFNTYSITFNGATIDESKYIDYVNNNLQLKANKFDCKPTDFLSDWAKATWHYEAPINHEGTVPLIHLGELANNDVRIIICGDGADESLGGYPISRRIDCFRRDLLGLRWLGVKTKAHLHKKNHFSSLDEHFVSLHQFINDSQLKELRPDKYKLDIKVAYRKRLNILHRFRHNDYLHKYTNYDLCTYGLDCLLRTEKMAMASGITIRSPFLMTELQEFIQTIPSNLLTDYKKPYMQSTKILLKELCADEFGQEFTYRPKIGLGIPILKIFKDTVFRQYIDSNVLPSIQKRKIVNYEYVKTIWDDTLNHSDDEYYEQLQVLWCSFSFEIWAKMYLDSSPLQTICNSLPLK